MNKNDQEFLVQKIRTQYVEKEHTQLDELKKLDGKVKKPANIFSLCVRFYRRFDYGRRYEPCNDRCRLYYRYG